MTHFLVIPTTDLDVDFQPTTIANALLRTTTTLDTLANGTSYRAFALNNFSGVFTPAAASITRLTTTNAIDSGSTPLTSVSSSGITAQAGSNRCAVLFVTTSVVSGGSVTDLDNLAATWGAANFTRYYSAGYSTTRPGLAMFYLLNANIPSGSQTITVSATQMRGCVAYLVEYANVNQTTPFGTAVTANNGTTSGTTATVTVNMTATTSLLLTQAAVSSGSSSWTVDAGTELYDERAGTANLFTTTATEQAVGATGNATHNYTSVNSGQRSWAGVEMFRA